MSASSNAVLSGDVSIAFTVKGSTMGTEPLSYFLENVNGCGTPDANDVRQADPRICHLACARFVPQMGNNFADVGDSRSAKWMTLGQQSAGNIYRNSASVVRCAVVQ